MNSPTQPLPTHENSTHPEWLSQFISVYQTLSTDNLELLATIYHDEIVFCDPMHELNGFTNLSQYFNGLYENVFSCDFTINHVIANDNEAALYWTMTYCHPKLNKGNLITVEGNSHIKSQDGKVIYHRDYLDLGAMLYEHLPVLGRLTQWVKNRAAQ